MLITHWFTTRTVFSSHDMVLDKYYTKISIDQNHKRNSKLNVFFSVTNISEAFLKKCVPKKTYYFLSQLRYHDGNVKLSNSQPWVDLQVVKGRHCDPEIEVVVIDVAVQEEAMLEEVWW